MSVGNPARAGNKEGEKVKVFDIVSLIIALRELIADGHRTITSEKLEKLIAPEAPKEGK